jgi:hypothetical protein
MRNRWLVATLLALAAVTVLLLQTSLLWTVPAPVAVTIALYGAAATPALGYARGHWRGSVGLLVGTALTATVAAVGVLTFYQPPGAAIRQVLAHTGLATDSNASGCRYLCLVSDGPNGARAYADIRTTDVSATCRQARERLVAQGWTLAGTAPAGCPASLTRPAALGRRYELNLGATVDDPVGDTAPDGPGRLLISLRAV